MTRLRIDSLAAYTPTAVDDQPHDAAVMAPIVDRDGEDHLLFTRRADHLGEHPGQMSFPGGGVEPVDETLFDTALREANEEIGLDPDEVAFVSQLDDIRTVTEYAVTPFVVTIPDRHYVYDEREVAEIAVLPVSALLDPANYEYEHRSHPYYGEIVVHYFRVDGYTVWGATGRILVQLLSLSTPFDPPVNVDQSRY